MLKLLAPLAAVLSLTATASAQQCRTGTCYAPVQAAAPIVQYQAPQVFAAPLYVVPSAPTVVVQQAVQYQYVPQVQQQVVPQMVAPQYVPQAAFRQQVVQRQVIVQPVVVQKSVIQRAPVQRSFSIQRTTVR